MDANVISNTNILIGPEQKRWMQLLDGRQPPNSVCHWLSWGNNFTNTPIRKNQHYASLTFFLLCADQYVFACQPSESKRDVTCDTTAACVLSCRLILFR